MTAVTEKHVAPFWSFAFKQCQHRISNNIHILFSPVVKNPTKIDKVKIEYLCSCALFITFIN